MKITEFLNEKAICTDLKATDKEGVIRELIDYLAKAEGLRNRDEITKVLNNSENISGRLEKYSHLKHVSTDYLTVEKIFVYLQILSACFVAFAHGANDVANAIGPLAGVLSAIKSGVVGMKAQVPLLVLLLGGLGIVIGLATWGWRVIETIGKYITE